MTAVAVDCAARDALKAKYAASIPAVCKILPAAIESRAQILRLVVGAGFLDSAFRVASGICVYRAIVTVTSTSLRIRSNRREVVNVDPVSAGPLHWLHWQAFHSTVCYSVGHQWFFHYNAVDKNVAA